MAKKSTKLEALHALFLDNGISADMIEKNDMLIHTIKKYADSVVDYRHPSYTRHLLGDIIMIVFFAILGNANEWGEIESFARKKEAWLRKYLELPYGVPTDDTYRIVIGNINTDSFFHLTVQFLIQTVNRIIDMAGKGAEIYEKGLISVDGKESRGSKRKNGKYGEERALQTLNVYSGDYGICLAQEFIPEKTNEIPAAQEVLKLMDLHGMIVTADAMNCQKETVRVITESHGDYVLALKENQPLFYQDVKDFFDETEKAELRKKKKCYKKTTEKEQGGTAVREYYIAEDTDWYSEKKEWKQLSSFGMVHRSLKKPDGSIAEEDRYYICSIGADVDEFERAARGHWGVEIMHWQMDFTFRDDKNTSMARTGAKNLQIMKKIVMSVLQLVKESYKLSMKRIRYELSLDYENGVEKMLSMLNPGSIEKALGLESEGSSSME